MTRCATPTAARPNPPRPPKSDNVFGQARGPAKMFRAGLYARVSTNDQQTLAMQDGVYDPTSFNDRLLLGLKGAMSEAELHVLKARLRGGIVNKARRGEYRCPLSGPALADLPVRRT